MEAQVLNIQSGEHGIEHAADDHRAQRARRICPFPIQAEHQWPQEYGLQPPKREQV